MVRDDKRETKGLAVGVHFHVQPAENFGPPKIVLFFIPMEGTHQTHLSAEQGRDRVDNDKLDVPNAWRMKAILKTVLTSEWKNRNVRSEIEELRMNVRVPHRYSP